MTETGLPKKQKKGIPDKPLRSLRKNGGEGRAGCSLLWEASPDRLQNLKHDQSGRMQDD